MVIHFLRGLKCHETRRSPKFDDRQLNNTTKSKLCISKIIRSRTTLSVYFVPTIPHYCFLFFCVYDSSFGFHYQHAFFQLRIKCCVDQLKLPVKAIHFKLSRISKTSQNLVFREDSVLYTTVAQTL